MNTAKYFLLILIFSFGAVHQSSEAKTILCSRTFDSSVTDILELININNNRYLFKDNKFENLSWLRQRKVRKLLNNFEIKDFASVQAVDRYAIELSLALYGQKNIVDRWLLKSADQRLEESTQEMIRTKLISEGLIKTWQEYYVPENISITNKILDRFWVFQNSKIGQILRLPFFLPNIKDQKLSNDLMYKVMRDGFNQHAEEVKQALNQQTHIDAYNTFKRIYSPSLMGFLLLFQLNVAHSHVQQNIDAQVNMTIQSLQSSRGEILSNIKEIKLEEYNNAYNSTIEAFIKKWGEPPTAEESQKIKDKLRKALNCDHC